MADNKSTYSSLMNELVDVINEKANSSDSKNLEELVATAKTIVKPEGTLEITENKQYDVSGYALANVNVASSGGGDTTQEVMLIEGKQYGYSNSEATSVRKYGFYNSSITSIDLPNATSIGQYAFQYCSNLTSANIPNATSVGKYAFSKCSKLTSIDLPNATSVGDYGFTECSNLTSANIPNATSIGEESIAGCSKLTSVNISKAKSIASYAFYDSCSLKKVVITQTDSVCTLANKNAFTNCYHITGGFHVQYNPNSNKDGYIYVPDSLVDSYKTATNWSTYADQIKPLSELEE